ncbi:MAG: TonB-dependent receptor [Candidatus Solibacter sp.]|nr:TonB-dependent receptor [Candidatus Solibacter sp.]
MRHYSVRKLTAVLIWTALILTCSQRANAQARIVGSVSVSVKDPADAVIPGAKVVLKDEGTGITKQGTTNEQGGLIFPDLSHGLFEISVSAPGFQTAVVSHLNVETSRTTDVVVSLKVGAQEQSITVEASAEVLETSSNLVSSVVSREQIQELPFIGRSTLALARLVPGEVQAANSPVGQGDTRFNNVPGGAVNVTLDGINNASNGYKSGGTVFYTTVPARAGAIEEVSVETTGLGADSGGQSGVNIKFVTRRGTNQYHGSAFYQPRSEIFNANTWLRNAQGQGVRTRGRFHEFGGNLGGRLVPFGKLKDKLFFFINYEYNFNPNAPTKSQNVLMSDAQKGIYSYKKADGSVGSVNVLTIAAQNGFSTALDPAVQQTLGKQNTALGGGYTLPIVNNFNQQSLNWQDSNNLFQYYPTTRLDYYLKPGIQLTGTWNLYHSWQAGTRTWPIADFPKQNPFRIGGYFTYSGAVNWTVNPRAFNEFRYGVQHSGDSNAVASAGGAYNTYNNQPLRWSLPYVSTLTADQQNVTGRHYITTIYDTATLTRGDHNITFGGSYRRTDWKDTGEVFPYPIYTLGVPASDPISAIYNTTSLPGVNTADLGGAASLYALLTGRISGVRKNGVVDPKTKQYGGDINYTWTRSHMGGLYIQDRWRVKPNFTVNYGFRWEFQGDMFNVDGIVAIPDQAAIYGPSTSLFTPGVMSGQTDPLLKVGSHAYPADMTNPGGNIGFAWNPRSDKGLLGKVFHDGKTVIRGSYSLVYYDEGSQMFAATVGSNPGGKTQTSTFTPGAGGIAYNLTLQDLLTKGLPAYTNVSPASFVTTIHASDLTFVNTYQALKPTLRAPYTINWNFGIQREIAANTVLQVNYVGNTSHHGWRQSNLNEVNIFENGFLSEFVNAQNNLKINTANGFAGDFSNRGFAGESALPILQTAFGARGAAAALAASQGFANPTYVTFLQNGAAGGMAGSLATNQNTACRMFGTNFTPCARVGSYSAAGPYPINFWMLNPYSSGSLQLTEDSAWNNYNGLQFSLRKRAAKGLSMQVNYTFSKGLSNTRVDNANQNVDWTTRRNLSLDRAPSPFDIRHVLQVFGTYDLPVGKGRMLNINNRLLDALVGGWAFSPILTIQSGSAYPLTGGFQTVNNVTGPVGNGVTLASGVSLQDVQNAFTNSQGPVTNRYAIDKGWIAADGRANTSKFLTPSTPGVFGQFLYVYGKNFFGLDAAINKEIRLREKMRIALQVGATNVLNHPEWGMGTLNIQSTSFGQTGGPYNQERRMQFRGVFNF